MKIVLAPDKFRGSLSARQVAAAMTEGIALVYPEAEVVALPLADGGEGTAYVLTEATHGTWHTITVSDPLGRPVRAGFGVAGDGQTAFIEMAQASGLSLLKSNERNPAQTSTYGTGELIRHALKLGVRHVVLGIGGSATTDAGMGMAAALGWQFLNADHQPLKPSGAALNQISHLVAPAEIWPPTVAFSVACDVANPLFGPEGAAHIYAPQKGATPAMVMELDSGLRHLARVVQAQFGVDVGHTPGAGAAGGLGAGTLFFLGASLRPGADVVLDAVGFDQHLAGADLVLTGEGKLDRQTLQGKLLKSVANRVHRLAKTVPVVALCGTLTLEPAEIDALGLMAAFSVLNQPQLLEEAVMTAYADVRRATFTVCRLLKKRY